MTTTVGAEPSYRRAAAMMTATSFLVPLGGLATAPILAHGLGAVGRGEFAAALAPGTLILGVATLGLPEALTFHVAKRPSITRRALAWSAVTTTLLGAVSVIAVWLALPFLSAGDPELARLILLASFFTAPALLVGILRGAATGRQMWGLVAWERIVLSALRVGGLAALLLADQLTVASAAIATVAAPLVSGLVYLPLLAAPPRDKDVATADPRIAAPLYRYGSSVWLGGIATMVSSRVAALIMLPLSDAEQLGLYAVASTVADVPLLVTFAIQGTLFGVSSRKADPHRVTATARLTTLLAAVGCLAIGVTLPFWIAPVFGAEFSDATVPALIRLASAVIVIPGMMASSSMGAWGRPGLRSTVLITTLAVNVSMLLLLVPVLGAYGAAWAAVAGTATQTALGVAVASRVMKVPAHEFLVPRRADAIRLWHEVPRLAASFTRRR